MASKSAPSKTVVLVGSRKGLFVLKSDDSRKTWRAEGPHFLGQIVNHAVLNPITGTILVAARAGHLGPTVFRSTDGGTNWQEAATPPAFPKNPYEGKGGSAGDNYGWVVNHLFWLTRGHVSEPQTWYAGSSPHGLFRSEDDGVTWRSVDGLNLHPDRLTWLGGAQESPPDGATLHSINVDPFDKNHLLVGMSSGGVFESYDRGANWKANNRDIAADFLPDSNAEFGHDPHCVQMHPTVRDVVYQQNHCGIYRLGRAENRWTRIGDNMPRAMGDIGFPVVLHPRDPATLWVFPMDGTSVWPRMSVGGKPAVYCSRDSGASWIRQDQGLPPAQAWFTVKRQAMSADQHSPVGLYFGTTGGEVWTSFDEGKNWQCMMLHLPHIYSVEAHTL